MAKALADVIHISGWDGGTGASALSSIKNAGLPWEIGVAETHQTLVLNGLRDRVRVRVDGGMKSGRDVIAAALLGCDEFSFGTSLLLAEGCIMVRACHRNTCPVGIATQRADLRAKFTGKPEEVARYLRFVAEECRRILASLGLRSIEEAIGRMDLLKPKLDSDPGPEARPASDDRDARGAPALRCRPPDPAPDSRCWATRSSTMPSRRVMKGDHIELSYPIHNSDRTDRRPARRSNRPRARRRHPARQRSG